MAEIPQRKGKVSRLYVTRSEENEGITYVRLDIPEADAPKKGYFQLNQRHPNYNALYSLALTAATNGYELNIRTEKEITPDEYAIVWYMTVDW
jgi:hypothetical protein